jgi:hypothetical protein
MILDHIEARLWADHGSDMSQAIDAMVTDVGRKLRAMLLRFRRDVRRDRR